MIRNHLLDPESSPQGDASSSSGGFANSGSNYGNATATASGSGSMQDDWYGGGVGGGPGNIAGSAAAGGGGSDGYGGIGQQGFVQPQHQHQPHQQYPQQQLPQPPQPPQQHGFGSDVGGGGGYVNMHTGMDMGGDLGGGVLGGGGGGMEGSMGGALEDEAPLLEELGIRPQTIVSKTMAVLRPRRKIDPSVMDDADLAGPLVFCLALGSCLLLAGKVHFGYIYGFSVFGCVGMHTIINLIHPTGMDLWLTCSVLGYCVLPVVILSVFSIVLSLQNSWFGILLSVAAVAWSTSSATRLMDAKLQLTELYWLVAYPTMLMYCCFVLITIF